MPERAEEQQQEKLASLAQFTTEIVAAYVSQNIVAMADLGQVIDSVGRELESLGREEPAPARPEPAVPARRSIQEDHLVCLVCGKRQKTLRRHLAVAHQLTPEAYRKLFGLGPKYPMTAPSYSRQRSEMAWRPGKPRASANATPPTERPRLSERPSRPRAGRWQSHSTSEQARVALSTDCG